MYVFIFYSFNNSAINTYNRCCIKFRHSTLISESREWSVMIVDSLNFLLYMRSIVLSYLRYIRTRTRDRIFDGNLCMNVMSNSLAMASSIKTTYSLSLIPFYKRKLVKKESEEEEKKISQIWVESGDRRILTLFPSTCPATFRIQFKAKETNALLF